MALTRGRALDRVGRQLHFPVEVGENEDSGFLHFVVVTGDEEFVERGVLPLVACICALPPKFMSAYEWGRKGRGGPLCSVAYER